jgi:hypothetical protein
MYSVPYDSGGPYKHCQYLVNSFTVSDTKCNSLPVEDVLPEMSRQKSLLFEGACLFRSMIQISTQLTVYLYVK